MTAPSPLSIRGITIDPPLVLAPMAGLTHSALRTIIAGFKGAGLLSTEMLSAKSLPHENISTSPYLIRSPQETPLSFQVLASDPATIAPAFEKLHEAKADAIDINLGCRAPKVRRMGAGYELSKNHSQLEKVLKEVRKRTDLALTAKIRLGKSPDDPATEQLCKIIEECGLDLIYVHARLEKEGFNRPPRWNSAARIKEKATIPVFVNGGIFSEADARKCLMTTGADGIMIGRAAASYPWIFSEIAIKIFNKAYMACNPISKPDLYRKFFLILSERFPKEKQLGRLKEFTHYFSKNYKFGHRLAWAVQTSPDMETALEKAKLFFERNNEENETTVTPQ